MPETLTELVAKISVDTAALKKGLSDAEKDVNGLGKSIDKEAKSIKDSFLEIGKVATVMGVAITAAMTKMLMSFSKTGSELYDLSLKTGVSVKALAGLKYAAEQNGASLGTIEMAIRRTASALVDAKDGLSETKRAFDRMGLSLQELEGLNPEQQFLKIAGAIAQIPDPMTRAATAVDLFGRSGMDMLPMLSQGADGLKKLMEQGQKASGWTSEMAKLADDLGDAFGTLGTTTGGLVNTIASALAPLLKDLANMLVGIVENITEWVKNNPGLVKAITTATIAVGLFATAIGLASIAVKVLGTTTNLYFGGILLIIGAVVTGVVLLIDWFNRAGIASGKLAEENKAALEKQQALDKTYFANKRAAAEKTTAAAKIAIEKEYGAAKDLSKSLIDMAYDTRDNQIKAINDKERVANDAYNKALSRAEDEYRLSLSKEERALQDQIDAIDKQTSVEDLALTRANEQKRLASLTGADYYAYAEEIKRNELLRSREVEKQAIRDKIQELRDETGSVVAEAQRQRDEKIRLANEGLVTELANQVTARAAAETKLIADIAGYEKDRDAKIKLEGQKLENVMANITLEEATLNNSYARKLADAEKFHTDLKDIFKPINQVINITTIRTEVSGGGGGDQNKEARLKQAKDLLGLTPPTIPGFATGGVVPGSLGQPQLAMVHGGETIIPANESATSIVINFTQPVFLEREDQLNRFADIISKAIDRKQRLRFGGAYSG